MARRQLRTLGLFTLGLGALACGAAPETSTPGHRTTAALRPLASCGDVEAALRAAALADMNRKLDENVQSLLDGTGGCWEEDGLAAGGAGGGAGAPPPSAPGGGAEQVSGTNNQVAGVDEADFLKNDHEYIYVLSGSVLHILDAWPAAEAHEVSRVELEGIPKKLFVAGDRALVYSSMPVSRPGGTGGLDGYGGGECTYGYDCDFTGDGLATRISVLDVSDRSAPILLREVDLSGSYINARRAGTAVHTVVHDARSTFDGVQLWPDDVPRCGDVSLGALASFAELRARNETTIETAPLGDWLPSMRDTRYANGETTTDDDLLASCEGFYASPLGDGRGFVTVLSLDLEDPDVRGTSTIVSRPGAVYSSPEAMYVAVRQYANPGYGWYDGMRAEDSATVVHEFDLDEDRAAATYAASGVVKGAVLNQFAMDAWDGSLRIATTSGHAPSPDTHSTLTVLRRAGRALVETGRVDHIAPSEDIRSVRFSGDRGYVVTFKKTDPLYVFDLADPAAPAILGELKIPGFSTYMHRMDETHLLTIGYDADDQGSFAWFQGVMLQIFDVSDPASPTLTHKEVIGTRGSSSEALTNHLAFNYFPAKDLLAFPITVCEGGSGGSYGMEMTFSGLMVYDVTAASGFSLEGRVSHPTDPTTGGYDSSACSNWWTRASSTVKRSIIMDDYVFSVSEDLVKVNALATLGADLRTIPLGEH